MKRITVLIVDDSALIREMLCEIFAAVPDIEVVGTAFDPMDAREKIKQLNPDVLTLDIEMPKMDGLSFLEKIMALRPMPVVMSSSLTQKGAEASVRALEIGAIECVGKPTSNTPEALQIYADDICAKVRIAAGANVAAGRQRSRPVAATRITTSHRLSIHAPKIIAIGASTGGVETLTEIMTVLPAGCPPIVITQHMPPVFTASFANRLSGSCAFPIHEAADGMVLKAGMACIAPGGKHLKIVRKMAGFVCQVIDGPAVNNHRPSIDVTFDSLTEIAAADTLGIILTGMGKDGAAGLLRLRQAGAHTIGQDEKSCIVYGMPQVAFKMGAVEEVLPLSSIASTIVRRCFQ
jgi:two-component system chemotaxis response regulator CheB